MTVGGRHRRRLLVGDPDAVNLAMVKAPYLSLVLLLTARSAPSSAVGRTARAARGAVRPAGQFAMASMLASAQRAFPDVAATPIPPTVDVSVDEQVQRLRDLPDDVVVEDVTRTFDTELPPVWRAAADLPRRWLDSHAWATMDAWSVVSPWWQRAQPLFELEARRVGAAVVRGCTDVLLNSLHPRMHYEDGEFWVPATREVTDELGGRRLVLVPTVAGPMGRVVSFDRPDIAYVAYPVPGQSAMSEHCGAPIDPGGDALCRMLGLMRAQVLRTADGPVSMGKLAAAVGCSPRVTSYHCDKLEATGLILRERRGQSVMVSRTMRGHALVELLSA